MQAAAHNQLPPISTTLAPISQHNNQAQAAIRRSTRACDACRRRKVRCNGAQRCHQYTHLNITCIYSASNGQKRSRKLAAPRGTVIEACRSDAPSGLQSASPVSPPDSHRVFSLSSVLSSSEANLHASFFEDLLPDYMAAVYPVNPVVTEAEIRSCISRMLTDNEAQCFLLAYAAVTVNLTEIDDYSTTRSRVSSLVEACLDKYKPLSHVSGPPTIFRIMTCIFLEICLMGLRKADLGLLYLREAISCLYILHLHDPESQSSLSLSERIRRERLYWECFIHERFAALAFDRTVILSPLPQLPARDSTIPYAVDQGWLYTIQIFCLIDHDFVSFWLRHRIPSPDWLKARHKQLEDDQWTMEVSMLPAMQQADLIITRQWLRTMLWQMAISNVILSTGPSSSASIPLPSISSPAASAVSDTPRTISHSPFPSTASMSDTSSYLSHHQASRSTDRGPSLTLPLQLSSELKSFLSQLSYKEVGVHGSGILHKLFEITNAIIDVILQLPNAPDNETRHRIADLVFLKGVMQGFPRVDRFHMGIIEEKFERLRGLGVDIRDWS